MGHEINSMKVAIKDNESKVKANKQYPYLVANIVEILDLPNDEQQEEDGGTMAVDTQVKFTKNDLTPWFPLLGPLI